MPGEWYSPTQPFVTKPPAFDRQGVTIDDLIDFTPELRAEAVKLVSRYKLGPIFTPPIVSKWEGPLATLTLPTATGGANWQGGSFDPETKMFYIFSNTRIGARGIVPADPARDPISHRSVARRRILRSRRRGGGNQPRKADAGAAAEQRRAGTRCGACGARDVARARRSRRRR